MDEVLGSRPTETRESHIPNSREHGDAQAQADIREISRPGPQRAESARRETAPVSLDDRLAIAVKAIADRGAALPDLTPSVAGSPSESLVRMLVDASRFSPIQAVALSAAMSGRDFIGHVPQGVDRQRAYAIPLLHQVVAPGEAGYDQLSDPGQPQAVVVVPTPVHAIIVGDHLARLGVSARRAVRIVSMKGNDGLDRQADARKVYADVVVGTVDRLADLIDQGNLSLEHAHVVVLDGADEMADLGLLTDVEALLEQTPARRRTMLFSAAMSDDVAAMARRIMHLPLESPAHTSYSIAAHEPVPADATGATAPPARRTSKRRRSIA